MREHIPKTQAKSLYCLSDKDLAPLSVIHKKNPYRRAGPPMQLYKTSEVEALAAAKHGGLQGLAAEQSKRSLKRAARAEKKAAARAEASAAAAAGGAQEPGAGAAAAAGPAGHLPLSHLILERVRLVSPTPLGPPQPPTAAAAAAATVQASAMEDTNAAAGSGLAADTTGAAAAEGGQYVMYWMQTAVRAYENPALDVAAAQAHHLGLPLLVVAALLQSHPYATARRYQFLLEGLREVQQQLQQQGVPLLVLCEGLGQDTTSTSNAATTTSSSSSTGGWWGSAAASAGVAAADGLEPQVAARLNAGLLSPAYQQHLANSSGWRSLMALASRAALVVTEDMPVAPEAVWVPAAAAEVAASGVPVWAVDTACVVPMRLTQRGYERAAGFRSATEGLRQLRVTAVYPPAAAAAAASVGSAAAGQPPLATASSKLPTTTSSSSVQHLSLQHLADLVSPLLCQPVDLLTSDLPHLVSRWPGLDQSVLPVTHLPGGTTAALQRWQQFKVHGLHLYAARRNDALQREGVSRLSAYHHYGMVSPFQVAREAKFSGGVAGVKFLDEFLVWREIAYHFCFHRWPVLDTLEALPSWAAASLTAHAGDPRPQGLTSLPQLEAGTTGDAFWDAAQHQLVTTGELHNNVRMTWGKALLQWSSCPQAALGRLLHLNHRYALDGCDPASYGGVLWCFGQFDGPRQAGDTPVTGSVRLRPTAGQVKRLPPEQYRDLPV